MKKQVLLTAITLGLSLSAMAQDAAAPAAPANAWKKSAQFGINLAAAGFDKNWKEKQGGFNSTSLGFLINAKADKIEGKNTWTNDLQLQYGNVRAEFDGENNETRKSIDKLFFDSKFARKINSKLNGFVAGNFLSQFAQGLDYKAATKPTISSFLAPGVLQEGIGLEYKPVTYFTLQFGGASLRQTFVNNSTVFANTKKPDGSSYGVPSGKTSINDMGFNIVAAFDKNIAKDLNLKWRYNNFIVIPTKSMSDPHKKIDHRLDLVATAKLSKYINANFTFIGLYDADMLEGIQRNYGLNVGLLYSL